MVHYLRALHAGIAESPHVAVYGLGRHVERHVVHGAVSRLDGAPVRPVRRHGYARGGRRSVGEPEEGQRVAAPAIEEEVLAGATAQLDGLDERHAQDALVEGDRRRHVPTHQRQVVHPTYLEALGHRSHPVIWCSPLPG